MRKSQVNGQPPVTPKAHTPAPNLFIDRFAADRQLSCTELRRRRLTL
jgi:hypothetical protein